ncbi:MAG TPA: hypothetical protein VFS53_06530 [Gemmatimonadota bacterium]|nr:hypothetical protein [Gemmatimonadota bacterium]
MRCAERRPGAAFAPHIALAVLVAACAGEATTPSSLGQPLPIGTYTLTVERTQPAPVPGPPISSFREQPGREGVLVVVRWAGLEDLDAMSRIAFAEKYLEDRLSVLDSTGERIEPTAAMQSALLFMNDPGDNWRDWIVLFHLPEASAGRVLEIENLDTAEGQPARFEIVLPG